MRGAVANGLKRVNFALTVLGGVHSMRASFGGQVVGSAYTLPLMTAGTVVVEQQIDPRHTFGAVFSARAAWPATALCGFCLG